MSNNTKYKEEYININNLIRKKKNNEVIEYLKTRPYLNEPQTEWFSGLRKSTITTYIKHTPIYTAIRCKNIKLALEIYKNGGSMKRYLNNNGPYDIFLDNIIKKILSEYIINVDNFKYEFEFIKEVSKDDNVKNYKYTFKSDMFYERYSKPNDEKNLSRKIRLFRLIINKYYDNYADECSIYLSMINNQNIRNRLDNIIFFSSIVKLNKCKKKLYFQNKYILKRAVNILFPIENTQLVYFYIIASSCLVKNVKSIFHNFPKELKMILCQMLCNR